MDYGGAFVYMFSSQDWVKKLILGIAMSLTPILGPMVLMGYALDVLRNLNQGQQDPLPEWTGDDFARWLGRGMGLSVSMLTFFLPVIIVVMVLNMCSAITLSVVGSNSDALGSLSSLLMCCVGFILYFVVGLGALVVYVRYATTDQLDVGMDYAKTFQLVSANVAPLLIIIVLMLVLWIAYAIVGVLTLGILFLALPMYFMLVMAYFGAQLSKQPGFES
jgi:hypothetical protein